MSPVVEGRISIGGRSVRLLGIEPVTMPVEASAATEIGRTGAQAFLTPPGQALIAPETLASLGLAEGATPALNDGALLPPLKLQPQLAPGVLVVDIGIAQKLLKMPDQILSLIHI